MLSISKNISCEYIIKKSRFISFLFRVDNIDEVKNYLNKLNNKYNDSTHICFAYIIDNAKRFNDDGEPGGTAGMPILKALENNNLNHILCCVVRYFGGIKLGAGGLVRAYTNSSTKVIDSATIINLVKGKIYIITFNYNDTKNIENIVSNVLDKEYNEQISYKIKISNNELEKLKELSKYCKIEEIDECYVESSREK